MESGSKERIRVSAERGAGYAATALQLPDCDKRSDEFHEGHLLEINRIMNGALSPPASKKKAPAVAGAQCSRE
jgi:hypothetical protein